MSTRAALTALASLTAVAVALACSASNNSSNPIVPFTPCLSNALSMGGAQDQCYACVLAKCQNEGHAFDSACAPYVDCICTDGRAPDPATLKQCAPMLVDPSCEQGLGALQACQARACSAQCVPPDAASDAVLVTDAPSPGDAMAGDGEAGPSTVTFSCSNGTGTMMECDQQQIPASSEQAAEAGCAQVGGAAGNGCPTQGLAGCCRLPTTENCYYDPKAVQQRQSLCESSGGTWSSMP